jgi:hypothetical protein
MDSGYVPGPDGQRTLFEKMARVQGALDPLAAEGEVSTSSYSFRYITESQLLEAIRPLLANERIAVFVSVESQTNELIEVTKTRRDGAEYKSAVARAGVEVAITFADGGSGEMFTIKAQGAADDPADKAVYKAITSACRYAWWKQFLVPTDQDDVNTGGGDYEYGGGGDEPRRQQPQRAGRARQPQRVQPAAPPGNWKEIADRLEAIEPGHPWPQWVEQILLARYGVLARSELEREDNNDAGRRFGTLVLRLEAIKASGDFPPLNRVQVQEAIAAEFDGLIVFGPTVPLSPDEAEQAENGVYDPLGLLEEVQGEHAELDVEVAAIADQALTPEETPGETGGEIPPPDEVERLAEVARQEQPEKEEGK